MSDLEKFAETLYGKQSGYVYVATKQKDLSWNQEFFNWPFAKQKIFDYIRTSSLEADVYMSPVLYTDKSGKKEAIKNSSVVWIEFDGNQEVSFKDIPEPSIIVQTSASTRLHCYWVLDAPLQGSAVEDINRRLTYHLDADFSGWDSSQVLRPPETTNYKYQQGKPVTLISLNDNKFSPSVFDKAPKLAAPPTVIVYNELIPEGDLKIPAELQSRVFKEITPVGSRSTFLMNSAYLLAEAGLEPLEIISALYIIDCRIKKFVGRSDQLLRLSEITSLAKLRSEKVESESYSPLEIINHELDLDWYLDGWLHSQGMMILSGPPGIGKTQFALNMAYCLATATQLVGKSVTVRLKVAVISLEMDVVEMKYIFALQANEYEHKLVWDQNVRVFTYEEGSLDSYERDIKAYQPDVVIIDSLSELASDDLNESEARRIMRWFKKIRRTYDCGIIAIHHNRKASDSNKKPRRLSDLYGSFIFAKLSESVISLWQDEGASHLEVDTLKVRFGRTEKIKIKRSENLVFSRLTEEPKEELELIVVKKDLGFN